MSDEPTSSNPQNQQTPPVSPEPNRKTENQPLKETVREVHHHHYERGNRFFPRFFWGIFIIFIGVMFLAQSVGLINGFDIGQFFSHIWPVFIILVGLSILSRGGVISGIISVIILIVILALIAAYSLGLPVFFGGRIKMNFQNRQIQTKNISVDKLAQAQSANVTVRAGAGQVNVSGDSDKLVTGNLTSNVTDLEVSGEAAGSIQNVNISTIGGWPVFGGRMGNTLTINLSTTTPMAVNLDAGASSQNLDFSEVKLTNLDVRAGASSVNLILGDKVDSSNVNLDSGASSVHITLPKTVGVNLTVDGGLTSKNFSDFKQQGNNTYKSNNYDQSTKKINLTLHGGASSFTVDWR